MGCLDSAVSLRTSCDGFLVLALLLYVVPFPALLSPDSAPTIIPNIHPFVFDYWTIVLKSSGRLCELNLNILCIRPIMEFAFFTAVDYMALEC